MIGSTVRKDDDGKSRMDLIDPGFLIAMGHVMRAGAEKYGDRNWQAGTDWGKYYAAAQRHLNAWWDMDLDDRDDETALSHLVHAACCIMILYHYERQDVGNDDRAPLPEMTNGWVTYSCK